MAEPGVGPRRGYYLLNTDGGNAGDALGRAAIGALLRTRRLVRVAQISKVIGPATHNVAEYRALIEGLKLARNCGIQRIRVYMDSELVVDQVNGVSAVRQAHLSELHGVASGLVDLFESIRISWVPREMNAEADRLVRVALSALDESAITRRVADDERDAEKRLSEQIGLKYFPGNSFGDERESSDTAEWEREPEPKPKAKKKSPAWKTLPDDKKAAYLLEHQTLADRTWTDEFRLKGERRDAFIRRILLGEGETDQTRETGEAGEETAAAS